MRDGRSPRIHLALTLWTLLLIGLVLAEVRHLPPGLTVLLVPYLALMAGHGIGRLRRRGHGEPAMLLNGAAEPLSDDKPDQRADGPGSDGRADCDDLPRPASPDLAEGQAAPPPRQVRARRRTRAPEPEPLAASWVQVQPGRFVRVEAVSPEHPADEPDSDRRPDEPQGATPPEEPGATPNAGPTTVDASPEVPGSEVEAGPGDGGAADATTPPAH